MIILKILFWFVVLYLGIFLLTCLTTYLHKVFVTYSIRKKDIEMGIIKENKKEKKKEYKKVWNSSLGVWEIED